MGKNKSKSGNRRPGKGPHPKAGQGKHNKANRSRSIGSSASLASREDLKSIDDNKSVNLDDFVVEAVEPTASPSNENNNSKSSSSFRATSPLPSTVSFVDPNKQAFTPIPETEEPPATPTATTAGVVATTNGVAGGATITKTPFNSPAAVVVAASEEKKSTTVGTAAAKASSSEPEVTTSRAPESSPEPTTTTTTTATYPPEVATDVDALWSSNLKDHVTVEPDGPAVLDVSTDYHPDAAALLVSPAKEKKSVKEEEAMVDVVAPTPATPTPAKVVETMSAAPPAAATKEAVVTASTQSRDLVVDLSAPHPSESKLGGGDDCQCTIL